jgi:predicted metal-dependent phosphoesterase TrpH
VEAYHPEHKKKQRKRYVQFAGAQQLFVTAGSDFHRDGLGRCTIALELLPEVFRSFVNHK